MSADGQEISVSSVKLTGSAAVPTENRLVVLTLATAVAERVPVTVGYDPPGASTALQDVSGNAVASFTGRAVTNVTDTTPPKLVKATVDGRHLTLVYDEHLDKNSAPAASAFTVGLRTQSGVNRQPRKGQSLTFLDSTVVAGETRAVRITLNSDGVRKGEEARVDYKRPANNPLQDEAGNWVAALTGRRAVNLDDGKTNSLTLNGNKLGIIFANAILPPSDDALAALRQAFTVQGGRDSVGEPVTNQHPLTVGPPARPGVTQTHSLTLTMGTSEWGPNVRLSYRPEAVGANHRLRISENTIVPGFEHRPVTNNTPSTDTDAPKLNSASVGGSTLTLTFDRELDEGSRPAGHRFALNSSETEAVAGTGTVKIQGSAAVVTLSEAAKSSYANAPWVSYTRGDEESPLQDPSGNAVANISGSIAVVVPAGAPRPVSADIEPTASRPISVHFDKVLDTSSVPSVQSFTATINGTEHEVFAPHLDFLGDKVIRFLVVGRLGIAATITEAEVSYSGSALRDLSGNTVAHFTIPLTAAARRNNTVDPKLSTTELPTVVGDELTLIFDQPLSHVAPAGEAFLLSQDTYSGVNEVVVRSNVVTLRLNGPVQPCDEDISLTYTKPDTNPLQTDSNAKLVQSFTTTVANRTGGCDSDWWEGARTGSVILRARQPFATNRGLPNAEWFTISASGGPATVTGVAFSSDAYELRLSLDREFADDETVTVSYQRPAGRIGLWSAAGRQLADFSEVQVAHTPPAEPPAVAAQFESAETAHDGRGVALSFTKAIALAGVHTAYTVTVDDEHRPTRAAVWDGSTVTLLLESPVQWGETATVSYAMPSGAGKLQDSDELFVESFGPEPVANTLPEPQHPLTAEFSGVPAEHTGAQFTFQLTFSEEPKLSFRKLKHHGALHVHNGGVLAAKRRTRGSNLAWDITVKPATYAAVTVALPVTTDCGAVSAICTADGRGLSAPVSATAAGPPGLTLADARVEESATAVLAFAIGLSRPASAPVTVDYHTIDGTAKAGEDYTGASGTLTLQAGETAGTIEVAVLDDAHDEGEETLRLRLTNPSGAHLADEVATGTIENTDLMPAALLARFGRATAEQVVDVVEERMAAPRDRAFRARFAGREFQPGRERDFALGFLSSLAPTNAAGADTLASSGIVSAGGMRDAGALGPLGTVVGHDPLANSEFELNRESRGGVLSLWSRSSRSHFTGMDGELSLDGDVRTSLFGADYSRGPLTVGLSLGRTAGVGGYSGPSGGGMTTTMTGVYPWAGYQLSDRVSVWGTAGYGTGMLSLTPDGAGPLETGVSMAMTAVGTRGELIGSRATGGFALAFKADAMWVGAASDLLDGAAGRLNASEAGVTRLRTALEGSRGFTLGRRLSLRPSVEVGLRRDGGDAETGAGMDVGGGLAFSDTVTGLTLDVRVRTLMAHQAEGFSERGMSLSFGWDPDPASPLGLAAKLAPSWGGQARGGSEALWSGQMAGGAGAQMYGAGDRVDAEVGYGLPVGARLVGTPRVGLASSQYGRDLRVGYGLGLLNRGDVDFEVGGDVQRRDDPMRGGAGTGFLAQARLGW